MDDDTDQRMLGALETLVGKMGDPLNRDERLRTEALELASMCQFNLTAQDTIKTAKVFEQYIRGTHLMSHEVN